jgi:hypothetical protein
MAINFESEEMHLRRLRKRLRAMSDEALITLANRPGSCVGFVASAARLIRTNEI